MSTRRRLFVGVGLDAEVGGELVELTEPILRGGPRTYPARDLHLTLLFLGAVPTEALGEIESALAGECSALAGPRLVIDRTGCFPERGKPRIWWAGVSEEPGTDGRLAACHQAVERALLAPEEREEDWIPHLTLARTPRGGGSRLGSCRSGFLALEPRILWAPARVGLFESRPERPEERYREIAGWPFLAGTRAGGPGDPEGSGRNSLPQA